MDSAVMNTRELRQMREEVSRVVNSLELCWDCKRVCECEQWVVNESVPVWLCVECLPEVAFRLEKRSGIPISLSPAQPETQL